MLLLDFSCCSTKGEEEEGKLTSGSSPSRGGF